MIGRPTLLMFSLCTLSSCGLDSTDNLTLGPTAAVPQYTVNLRTSGGGLFVSAENGGGGDVNANRTAALGWETFTIYDLNGGNLQNGDLVNIGTSNGHFVCAENGGGSSVNANRTAALDWETFRVVIINGSPGQTVGSGAQVALQTKVSGHFLSAVNGGGGAVRADRTAAGGWETFGLTITGSTGGGGGGGGGGSGGSCSTSQLAQCNCPADFYCCPTNGGCFQNPADVIFTLCKDNPASACKMPGAGPVGGTGGNLPTRLRISSRCGQPIWLAHSGGVSDAQNIRLAAGQSHDYNIPSSGLGAVRFWPKLGCDGGGHNCAIGDNGQGGGVPCPAGGCQPPIDSKFEVTFAPANNSAANWYNLSQVDGYTLPFKVTPLGSGAGIGSCNASDCGGLSLARCPGADNLSEGGAFPQYAAQDLRVRDRAGNVIGCIAPCKKLNYPPPWGIGLPESSDPALHMCCPTPIDPASGQCTAARGCMSPDACRNNADPRSVTRTGYVAAVHSMCPSAYSYAYDDEAGLHVCPSNTQFEVTFCP
jgi:hypothetical protein